MQLGLVEWFEVGEHERLERVLAGLRELGIERLRTGISWADWHRDGGERWYDELLPRLAREVEVLPCVLYTPPSLGIAHRSSAPPRRLRDYADFVDLVITRYGRHFEHLELWNEPNNPAEWDWTLDPQWLGFCEMVGAAAYWARRRGRKTVLGGMSPVDPNWLGLLAERGLLEHLDVVGVHGFPGTWESSWAGWETELTRVQDVLDRHRSRAEVWVTETGYSTWRRDELGQLAALLDAAAAPAPRMYWYAAEDLAPERPAGVRFHEDEREYHFGLRRSDGSPKLLGRLWRDGGLKRVRAVADAGQRFPSPRPSPAPSPGAALVTGGAGTLGSRVASRLAARGWRVVVLDNLSRPGSEERLLSLAADHPGRIDVRVADVRDRLVVRDALRAVDRVFHLASTASPLDPFGEFSTNVEGTLVLLEELRPLAAPPPLVCAFSAGDAGTGTTYGCSKAAVASYVIAYAESFGLPAVLCDPLVDDVLDALPRRTRTQVHA